MLAHVLLQVLQTPLTFLSSQMMHSSRILIVAVLWKSISTHHIYFKLKSCRLSGDKRLSASRTLTTAYQRTNSSALMN